MVRGTRAGLVGPGRPGRLPRRRAADGPGHERGLPVVARPVGAGHLPRGVQLDRRQRRGREHAVVPAVRRAAVLTTWRGAGTVVGERRPGRWRDRGCDWRWGCWGCWGRWGWRSC